MHNFNGCERNTSVPVLSNSWCFYTMSSDIYDADTIIGGWLSFSAFDKMDFVRKQWRPNGPNGATRSQPRATPWG